MCKAVHIPSHDPVFVYQPPLVKSYILHLFDLNETESCVAANKKESQRQGCDRGQDGADLLQGESWMSGAGDELRFASSQFNRLGDMT